MFYNELELEALIDAELKASYDKHPNFHSYHEGYGVVREELEEASEAQAEIWKLLKEVWVKDVRCDHDLGEFGAGQRLVYLCQLTESFAQEAVQVAAMMRKLRFSRNAEWRTPVKVGTCGGVSEGAGGHWECPCDGCERESECNTRCEWADSQDAPCTRRKWVPADSGDSCDT